MRRWALLSVLAACGGDDAAIPPDADPSEPTAASIDFEALDDLPSGEWLLANEWAGTPNTVFALPVDQLDAAPVTLFAANRVWSMGARADGAAIYFSAWDADQEAHFGVTIGDAIQNSFEYTPATRALRALSWGNLNDDCQMPSPDGHSVLFKDRSAQSRLAMFELDATDAATPVSPTTGAGAAAISPDGDTIVYAVFDSDLSCDHLERVTRSGNVWSAPVRVRDCADTGEFITDINWIVVP